METIKPRDGGKLRLMEDTLMRFLMKGYTVKISKSHPKQDRKPRNAKGQQS